MTESAGLRGANPGSPRIQEPAGFEEPVGFTTG